MPAQALQLASSILNLKGVGPAIQQRLARLGIATIQDCLFHLPSRYVDRTQIRTIGSVHAGESVLIQGVIELTQITYGKRRQLICRISDDSGAVLLRFFYFTNRQKSSLIQGQELRCWGRLRSGKELLEIAHPEYQVLQSEKTHELDDTLTPIYPSTEGISQLKIRQLSDQALAVLANDKQGVEELVPAAILKQHSYDTLAESLQYVHRPPVDANTDELIHGTHRTQKRLAFEELLAHQLSLRSIRKNIQEKQAHNIATTNVTAVEKFTAHLNFSLTKAQANVTREILGDLSKATPMLRLIQGDVGCGKTVVAAITALYVIHAGLKVALMAPTEILSDQHYHNINTWFSPLGIPVVLLNAKQARAEKQQTLSLLQADTPLLVIGTHALFQEQVSINQLGLVIIDEQHRFGVSQRLALLEKGAQADMYPHQLVMTATPIPRTLAMTAFAELDISVIDELPPGRKHVKTTVLSNKRRAEVINRISEICHQGRQVYWVCTLIETSDVIQLEPAEEIASTLAENLPSLKVVLIHGKMKAAEKEHIMQSFKAGAIDLLVATTVIEVGVDVPNANLMVIENAERLGLSQLHQLRGRVGRGEYASNCVLLYQEPLSDIAQIRLHTMRQTNDGFLIAQKDLQLRGPGELLGIRQTGLPELKIADFVRDAEQIPLARKSADQILEQKPEIADMLIKRWLNNTREFSHV